MSESTSIEWTDSTWNPWRGCRKVSAGCAHCYMYREQTRYGRDPLAVVRTAPATFNAPLRWNGPRRVFTCSWSDFFIEEADPWRADAWEIIRSTPQLTYQVLTKRPERIAAHLPPDWGEGWPNVWLGTSIESYLRWQRMVPLSRVPAKVRFVSAEPLLGSLALSSFGSYGIGWVIVGGESGPGARPMDPEWAREVRDLCVSEGIPYFLKQLGGHPDKRSHDKAVLDGRRWTEIPPWGGP